jgi:hypothetical protein
VPLAAIMRSVAHSAWAHLPPTQTMMVVPTVVPLVFEKMAPVGVHVLPIVGDVPPVSHVGIEVAVENREYP